MACIKGMADELMAFCCRSYSGERLFGELLSKAERSVIVISASPLCKRSGELILKGEEFTIRWANDRFEDLQLLTYFLLGRGRIALEAGSWLRSEALATIVYFIMSGGCSCRLSLPSTTTKVLFLISSSQLAELLNYWSGRGEVARSR